jgi:hypothetical protein
MENKNVDPQKVCYTRKKQRRQLEREKSDKKDKYRKKCD